MGNNAIILWRLCLAWCNQAGGAPLVDRCFSKDRRGRIYNGIAVLLTPWRRNIYGNSLPQRAAVIAWRRSEEAAG
jgi:hypothetical protein